ncbi:MAG: 16S rRNA (guanine(966)-N(2))-methyltransferase RsmD [Spirochaetales bacterium]|nr:16S rRNA (guanine(966)-N(2))-methyltransferase RsmD [Spirochaetales bacterium]
MHIVGGRFKGHPLFFTNSPKVRPMTQMVREAIFNILQGRIVGDRVLDLFCGSGGVGLEALSRGAKSVDFVDLNPAMTRRNIEKLGVQDETRVFRLDVFRALAQLGTEDSRYDFLFVGAPYEYPRTDEVIVKLDELNLMAPDGLLMVEHRSGRSFAAEYEHFSEDKVHTYGQTIITRYQAKE